MDSTQQRQILPFHDPNRNVITAIPTGLQSAHLLSIVPQHFYTTAMWPAHSYKFHSYIIHIRADLYLVSLWDWDPGHYYFVITCGHPEQRWSETYRFLKKKWKRVGCQPLFFIPNTSDHISVCLLITVSFYPPQSVLLIWKSLHYTLVLPFSVSPSLSESHLSHSHLSNSHPLLSISASAPYPSCSTSVGMTDCWNCADSLPLHSQDLPYNRSSVAPSYPAFLCIDYPTLQEDNQWAWPDFETWWVCACV